MKSGVILKFVPKTKEFSRLNQYTFPISQSGPLKLIPSAPSGNPNISNSFVGFLFFSFWLYFIFLM
jgi:hypothetical protein